VHRNRIAAAASALFLEKGVSATSMDDIAQAAGYSKATLYVYFENKEEIVSVLVLDSMKQLCERVSSAVRRQETTRARYDLICRELVRYQEEHPFYFQMTLGRIDVRFEGREVFPEERETYQIGEELNGMIRDLLTSGVERGELRRDLEAAPVSFTCWGMLAGLIRFAADKQDYIQSAMGLSKEQFLQYGFDMIYRSIEEREGVRK